MATKETGGKWREGNGVEKDPKKVIGCLFFSLTPLDAGYHSVLRYCLPI